MIDPLVDNYRVYRSYRYQVLFQGETVMALSDEQLQDKEVMLFCTHNIKNDREAEVRATSSFLAMVRAVSEFGKAIVSLAGGPKGKIRCYTEVTLKTQEGISETKDRLDGILQSFFGKKTWTAFVEVKVGNNPLEQGQLERYHTLADAHGIDAFITISNQAALANGLPPNVIFDAKRLKKVPVVHFSWERLLREAQLLSLQEAISDSDQQWMLKEWLRYLENPDSRIIEKPQLGEHWNTVLQHAGEGNLNACIPKLQDVVEHWDAFLKKAALRLRAKLGVDVVLRMPKAESKDTALRIKNLLEIAIKDGILPGKFRIPDAAGDLSIAVRLSSRSMQCSIILDAPTEGTTAARIKWLLKQLLSRGGSDAQPVPDDLCVQIDWGWAKSSQAKLENLKDKIDKLLYDGNDQKISKDMEPHSFSLQWTKKLSKGKGRSTIPVLEDIQARIEEFYSRVVERLRPFVPKAPKMDGTDQPEKEKVDVVGPIQPSVGEPLELITQQPCEKSSNLPQKADILDNTRAVP